jgi:hypothetical protein
MKILQNSILLMVGLLFFSCTEDKAILLEDSKFNKPIPQLPVNTDYTVGAIYARAAFKFDRGYYLPVETPSWGTYDGTIADPIRYEDHVKQAKTAGVDFFIFNLRSAQYVSDTTFVHNLQMAPNAKEMDFAFSYTFNAPGSSITSPFQEFSTTEIQFLKDFELMEKHFKKDNYMKIKGKAVVYMNNSFNLFAYDNTVLYQKLRTQMRLLGVELYLIGMQLEWTPTLRFFTSGFNRFNGCVDALTYTNYANLLFVDYDRKLFFHKYVDLAWSDYRDKFGESNHKATLAKYNIEFVPTISPSYTLKINNELSTNYPIAKNADWFKAYCNIARRASGTNKLVIIDSFNNWDLDTQIESATSYGDEYLKILRSEFKVN